MKTLTVLSVLVLAGSVSSIEISAARRKWTDETLKDFSAEDLNTNPFASASGPEALLEAQKAQMKLNYYNSLSATARKQVDMELDEVSNPALKTIHDAERHQIDVAAAQNANGIALSRRAEKERQGVYEPADQLNLLEYDAQDIIDAQSRVQQSYKPWVPGAALAEKEMRFQKMIDADPALKTIMSQQANMNTVKNELESVWSARGGEYPSANSTSLISAGEGDSPAMQTFAAQQKQMAEVAAEQAKIHAALPTAAKEEEAVSDADEKTDFILPPPQK